MKTIDDIRVVLLAEGSDDNGIVRQFTGLPGKEYLRYTDEISLGKLLESLKGQGFLSKEVLILKAFNGRIYQQCPGSPGMICCNYRLLNTCFGCLYDCTYCFLNSYLNSFGIVQFTSFPDIAAEVAANTSADRDMLYRVGTGEFTDSLMMDDVTGLGSKIIHDTLGLRNVIMEFKTKSSSVDHLLDIEEKGNTVMAWTLNTPTNVGLYEAGTANLDERLAAASRAGRAGYNLAFHFDPVIMYDGFLDDYIAVIDRLFSEVPAEKILWISIGCFRYSPGFKDIIADAFPGEQLTTGELFPGQDGKYRYLKKHRIAVYRTIREAIYKYTTRPFVYLCMESSDVWQAAFGIEYTCSEELERDFSDHLKRNFPELGW